MPKTSDFPRKSLSLDPLKLDPEYVEHLGLTEQISAWNEFAEEAAIEMRDGPKRETRREL